MNVYQILAGQHFDNSRHPTNLVVKDNTKDGAIYKANKFLNSLDPNERKLITGHPFSIAIDVMELKNEINVLG